MKILGLVLGLGLFLTNACNGHNNNWIAYRQIPTTVQSPIVEVPVVPSITYSTYPKSLIMMHDWVPYTVNHLVMTERYGLFCRNRTYHYETRTEWIYQPVWR